MTLPFMKNKEGSGSVPMDHIKMGGDEDSEDYGMLDAVAEDLMHAFEKKDIKMLKSALESLCEHIASMDEEQDEETMGEQS